MTRIHSIAGVEPEMKGLRRFAQAFLAGIQALEDAELHPSWEEGDNIRELANELEYVLDRIRDAELELSRVCEAVGEDYNA